MAQLCRIIVAILLCASAHAQVVFSGPIMRTLAIAAGCATTDSPIAGDELKFGWQPGDTGTWAVTGAGVTEGADTSALSSGKPTGACDLGLNVTYGGAAVSYVQWNRGTPIETDTDPSVHIFYLYIESIDTSDVIRIFTAGNSTTPSSSQSFSVALQNSGGQAQIFADGAVDSTPVINVAQDTWLKIEVSLGTINTDCFIEVNDASNTPFTRGIADIQYISMGAPASVDAGDAGNLFFDIETLNTP